MSVATSRNIREVVLRLVYRQQIDALEKVCDSMGYPGHLYRLFSVQEANICLELDENTAKWVVSCFEHGYRHGTRTHSNINDACVDLLRRLSRTEEDKEKGEELYYAYTLATANQITPEIRVIKALREIW